jgi:hypothetical protein
MASQAEIYRKKIKEYEANPFADPAVLLEMKRQYSYANTIDLDAAKKASDILNS